MLSHMMDATVTAEAKIRTRNQLTLPEPVVHAAGIVAGDRFVVEVTPDDPDTVRLHRVRASYAGSLRDLYGSASEYLETERGTWEPANER